MHPADKPSNLAVWTSLAATISGKGLQLVWATEKSRAVAGATLYKNFKPDASGEYLALTRPDDFVALTFPAVYPQRVPRIAYGVPVTE